MQQSHKNPGDICNNLITTRETTQEIYATHNNFITIQDICSNQSIITPFTAEVSTLLHDVISGSISKWLQYNLMKVRIHKSVVYEHDVKTHDVSPCFKHTMHIFFAGIVH